MITCPICNHAPAERSLCKTSLTYKTTFDLLECGHCRTKYYHPVPTLEQLSLFYSDHAYEFDRWRQEAKAGHYLRKLLKQASSGKLLDIGCASGYFISYINKQSDWDAYGVELGELPAKFARDTLGLNVIHGDLFSASYENNFFDAIYVGDVLEHVPNPVDFMRECRRILKPGGKLHLAVPNGRTDCRGLIRYFQEENKGGRHASGHIFFFEKESLNALFTKTGFSIDNSYTTLIKNGLRALGYLPMKRNWKSFYTPSAAPEVPCESKIVHLTERPHSAFYYTYHYYKKLILGLPGLRPYGFTFLIQLNAED